jgi:hypothetical protein
MADFMPPGYLKLEVTIDHRRDMPDGDRVF